MGLCVKKTFIEKYIYSLEEFFFVYIRLGVF
jgi:hypothetical protein